MWRDKRAIFCSFNCSKIWLLPSLSQVMKAPMRYTHIKPKLRNAVSIWKNNCYVCSQCFDCHFYLSYSSLSYLMFYRYSIILCYNFYSIDWRCQDNLILSYHDYRSSVILWYNFYSIDWWCQDNLILSYLTMTTDPLLSCDTTSTV